MSATTKRAACPICNKAGRDTAMAITTDERGIVAYCHRCQYTEANNHVTALPRPVVPRSYRAWQDLAAYLWDSSLPLSGTLASAYLQRRGCCLPPDEGDLRFLPARDGHSAAMLARITDVVTGAPISLHFTKLTAEGVKVSERPKSLLAGHRKAGGCIRLWPDEAVTDGLALAEGIESALAAAHGFTPIWSAIDAGNMVALPVLAGIESLTLIADHDDAGIRAARACAERWTSAGCEVRIAMPRTPGADAADVGVAA